MVACMTVALAGFVTFGDKTMGNALVGSCLLSCQANRLSSKQNNFPENNIMVNIARLYVYSSSIPLSRIAN